MYEGAPNKKTKGNQTMKAYNSKEVRSEIIKQLFEDGIPELWCPLLTQYDRSGRIDKERMNAQARRISPWVKNFLVPGSTGDGWEMSDEEIFKVLDAVLEIAETYRVQVLIGVLKTGKGEARQGVLDILRWLEQRTGIRDPLACLKAAHVCGFTVCPPKGRGYSQAEIESELAAILEIGVPTAVYQLPQITENEVSPETFYNLVKRFGNLYLFKDTSGNDKVALAGLDYENVFLVRGAEGNYDRWLKYNGGGYDGFLLSTANCFAKELYEVIDCIRSGKVKEAKKISEKLTGAVDDIFAQANMLPQGNAFTNANKVIDHVLAYGPNAVNLPGPRLHSGGTIPADLIRQAIETLKKYGLLEEPGYLQ